MKPAFDDFVLPTKKHADIIIPRGGDNHVAVDLIVQVSSPSLFSAHAPRAWAASPAPSCVCAMHQGYLRSPNREATVVAKV